METNAIHMTKQPQEQQNQDPSSNHQNPTNTSGPPSSSSSPSHEFSFTISLPPLSQTTPPTPTSVAAKYSSSNSKFSQPSITAVDLSPADDIFFQGHLLPLQLLFHPSISPRNSTTSVDNLNLPNRDVAVIQNTTTTTTTTTKNNPNCINNNKNSPKSRTKNTHSFSLFGLPKWRKAFEKNNGGDDDDESKKKARFDVGRMLRRYARAVRPILFFRWGENKKRGMQRQPYSFSGNLNSRWKEWGGRRGGQLSAPASMWTSPTNSGLLLATAAIQSSNDGTMEELQSAIQAAIAHCKNSTAAKEEKCKC